MDIEELGSRYDAGERDFNGADLREVDFGPSIWCGINLSEANLF